MNSSTFSRISKNLDHWLKKQLLNTITLRTMDSLQKSNIVVIFLSLNDSHVGIISYHECYQTMYFVHIGTDRIMFAILKLDKKKLSTNKDDEGSSVTSHAIAQLNSLLRLYQRQLKVLLLHCSSIGNTPTSNQFLGWICVNVHLHWHRVHKSYIIWIRKPGIFFRCRYHHQIKLIDVTNKQTVLRSTPW